MCLILFSFAPETDTPLIVLANRDEFYARDTQQAQFWDDHSHILAGRDNVAGGTWMGVHRNGRFAAVTNYRAPSEIVPDASSRGELTVNFLTGSLTTQEYLSAVQNSRDQYSGFNLIVFDSVDLGYYSNRSEEEPVSLGSGIYGLSNHLLDTPWPKVVAGKTALNERLQESSPSDHSLLEILAHTEQAGDEALPETGVGMELERILSARCIVSPQYGTRCSTLVRVSSSRKIHFIERTLVPDDLKAATVSFDIEP